MDVFYNSTRAQIDLSRLDAIQDITLYITDLSGRQVSRHTLPAGTSMFPVRDLSRGVYIYSVMVGARHYTGKFVY